MKVATLEELPPNARVWVFGSEAPLGAEATGELLDLVDEFLEDWAAHGVPLRAGRASFGKWVSNSTPPRLSRRVRGSGASSD